MTTETLVKVEYNMTIEEFKEHMTTIAKEINEITNTDARKWAIDKFIIDLATYFDSDTMSYVDGEVCNDYVNWDSNCGCSIIQASIDFKAIADYLIENDLEPTSDNVSEALCNLEERIECWTDVIDDNIHKINIDALEELMSMDSEDKGKAEFIADFNEYKRNEKTERRLNMKYAIQASYYMYNSETDTEYEQWLYLAIEGERKIFVFDEDVSNRTKIFNTAKEAGDYLDKHFSPDKMRCSFSTMRIVEINN